MLGVGLSGDPGFGQPSADARELVLVGQQNLVGVQADRAGGGRCGARALPRVQPEVVVITAGGQNRAPG